MFASQHMEGGEDGFTVCEQRPIGGYLGKIRLAVGKVGVSTTSSWLLLGIFYIFACCGLAVEVPLNC